jgi:hypothetical protein
MRILIDPKTPSIDTSHPKLNEKGLNSSSGRKFTSQHSLASLILD